MYDEKIILSEKDILEKDFKIDARGYRPQEVDKFLDIIMRDYSEFKTNIRRLEHDLKLAIDDNERLRRELRNAKSKLELVGENKTVTNVDILKRLSDLEKQVYGDNE